jgi:hypothetical protein
VAQHLLERGFGDGLVGRESHRSLRQFEPGERVAGRVDRLGAERKKAEVVLAGPEAQERPFLYLNAGIP